MICKKNCINASYVFVFLSFLSFNITAQSFRIKNDSSFVIGHVSGDNVGKNFIYNTSNDALTLTWRRVTNNPNIGTTAICDINICYPETTNAASFTLEAGDTGNLDVHFYPGDEYATGTGTVEVILFEPDDSANTVQSFTVHSSLSPISIGANDLLTSSPSAIEAYSKAMLFNHVDSTLTLEWKLLDKDITVGDINICVENTCVDNTITSGTFSLDANDSIEIGANFTFSGVIGFGSASLIVYNPSDSANIFSNVVRYNCKTEWGVYTKEVEDVSNLSVYPNPTRQTVNISTGTSTFQSSNVRMKLFNNTGELLLDQSFNPTFEIGNLPTGVYNLVIFDGSGTTFSKQLVKK